MIEINTANSLHVNTLQLLAKAVENNDNTRIICKSFISGSMAVVL